MKSEGLHEELKKLTEDDGTSRLDVWLVRSYPGYSRSYFHKLITDGHVLLNGHVVKKSAVVVPLDVVSVNFVSVNHQSVKINPVPMSFDILYEDDHLFVINKPAGMVVHPAPGHWESTFVHGLLSHCPIEDTGDEQDLRPGIVHRLDRETSGVLLSAKTFRAKQLICEQFANREVQKMYILLAQGRLPLLSCSVDLPVGRDPVDRKKMKAGHGFKAKEARTCFEELAHYGNVSLLLAYPKTGRQHQIRVHLRALEMTLLGDKLYGKTGGMAQRHMLHAFRYCLTHPIHKTALSIDAPPLADFLAVAKRWNLVQFLGASFYQAI